MDRQAIADAVTRGLTNLNDVTNAITDEITAADTSANLDRATTYELITELAARADQGGYGHQRRTEASPGKAAE